MANPPTNIHRYQILRRLGRGGMGIVYLAHDPVIGREVAIKVLRTLDEPSLFDRFQREIRIAGALSHPSLVRIYDAGEIDEQPFVAMEYIPGQTLDTLIKQAVPIDLDRKLGLLIDLALGLAYAHSHKVVHRDIKPSNLIVDEHDRLRILDFGVARFAGGGFTSHVAVGTPGYMSPEQLQGLPADVRSDIFAAGIVAYEFIAYRRPFPGKEVAAVYHRILHEEPPPLGVVAPGIPASLEQLVTRCLDKNRDSRLQDAISLASGLREVRESLTAEETTLTATAPAIEARGEFPSVPSTPRRMTSSTAQRVADLRRRVLQEAKATASEAYRRGDYLLAVDAAEHALVIDDGDEEAGAMLAQARAALDHAPDEPEPDPPTVPGQIAAIAQHVRGTPLAVPALVSATPDPATASTVINRDVAVRPPDPVPAAIDRAVWGRSVNGSSTPVNAVGLAISAGVHTALSFVVAAVMLSGYTLARPAKPKSLYAVIHVERASLPTPSPQQRSEGTTKAAKSAPQSPQRKPDSPTHEKVPQPTVASQPVTPVEAPTGINAELTQAVTSLDVPGPATPPGPPGPPGSLDEGPVNDADQPPQLITIVRPGVPEGASGKVRVEVTIASNGRVTRVRLLDETPYGALIVAAAEKCTFRPARRRGRAVAVNQILTFDLSTDR